MNEFVGLMGSLAVLWLVIIGGAFVVQRRDWAAIVFVWPFRTTIRLTSWAIGSAFVALGNAIRGNRQQQNRRRH